MWMILEMKPDLKKTKHQTMGPQKKMEVGPMELGPKPMASLKMMMERRQRMIGPTGSS